ncbi:MAG: response regulator transcription factor [Kineosporiaceae bacterium]
MRVLLIEDEDRLAHQVQRGLFGAGFTVDVAGTGTDGLWAALESPYEVIVCDIMLPGVDGYEVVRRLRDQGVWTPILMLTAKDGEHDQADALDLGADDYLTKPFSLVVLVARLKALIRRSAPEQRAHLTAGDLRLDPVSKQVFRGEAEIAVTPREFELLDYLLRRQGQAISKREILDTVWEAPYIGDPNVVEVYIGYLRKKIDAPFARHSIVTLRGIGYRLDPDAG